MTRAGNILHKILPYAAAAIVFAAISALYFAPQFSGKQLPMHDMTQYDGMSKEIRDHQQEYDEDPQWTGAMFGGMPAQLITMDYSDSTILRPLLEDVFGFLGRPASFIFIAMAAFFVMLLMFGMNPWAGIIPSLAYGLSTYFFLIIGAGHITKMLAAGYAPLMIGGMAWAFRRNMWVGGALTALFAALEIACNHPQITYYFLFVMAALWINEGVKAVKDKTLPRFAKVTGVLVAAGILAVGANLAPLWYINDYGKVSIRGGSELAEGAAAGGGLDLEYATAWSYGKAESFNMFIPGFTGGATDTGFSPDGKVAEALSRYGASDIASQLPTYWGPQPMTGGPTYIGAVVIFLFVLGLLLLCGRNKWWVAIVTLVVLMLSWGRNFMWFTELFFNYMPGYNKFRVVAMILVVVQWSVPFLAALVLNKIWRGSLTREVIVGGVKRAVYICGGAALFFFVFGGMFFDFTASYDSQTGMPADVLTAMRDERASMMRMDSLRSLALVLASAGVVWLFAAGRIKKGVLGLGLAALVCIDLVPVDLRFLPQSKFVEKSSIEIKPTAADLEIMEDTTPGYRVLNLTVSPFNDATTSYFHRSVGGYHGAKIQRYQDIIDRYLSKMDPEALNMLNTRYFIVQDEEQGPRVQYNPHANGPAWFVDEIWMVDTPAQEIEQLGELNTRYEAVVERRFADRLESFEPAVDSLASIEMTDYRSNYQRYEYRASQPGVAVFSEIYHRDWQAYIDGEPAPHFRADYILRGMLLPAGEHVVEFRYAAADFSKVSAITLIFSLLVILAVVAAGAGYWISNKRKKGNEQPETQA